MSEAAPRNDSSMILAINFMSAQLRQFAHDKLKPYEVEDFLDGRNRDIWVEMFAEWLLEERKKRRELGCAND